MLKTYDVSDCVVQALLGHDLTDIDYHLYGAGRAIAFIRMASDAIQHLGLEQKVAEYHAYAGISSARTAIDATASWLRLALSLQMNPSPAVDLHKVAYQSKVIAKAPALKLYLEALSDLAGIVDKHRQRAQHREGLALGYVASETEGEWYLYPKGLSKKTYRVRLVDILDSWADNIEENLCAMIQAIT